MSVRKEAPGDAEEQFSVTDWDHNMKFSGLSGLASYNVGNSNITDRLPSLSRFGSDSLSEIMSSLGLPYDTQMQEFPSANDRAVERNVKGKRRKKLSACDDQSVEDEARNNVAAEIATKAMERDEKQPKNGANPSVKGDGDVPKEDFVHVRARRGQATNSHSLAERVRREKISERMKLLQDLVPGCNKITGKAVMLDEIINYVQSLQKQVEFLSMKLATMNPEFDMDLEQIFSKENCHTRYGSSPALGYAHPELQLGMLAASLQNPGDHFLRIATNSQLSSMAQVTNAWGNELQNAIQRGLIPNLPSEGIELNSSMKVEL